MAQNKNYLTDFSNILAEISALTNGNEGEIHELLNSLNKGGKFYYTEEMLEELADGGIPGILKTWVKSNGIEEKHALQLTTTRRN